MKDKASVPRSAQSHSPSRFLQKRPFARSEEFSGNGISGLQAQFDPAEMSHPFSAIPLFSEDYADDANVPAEAPGGGEEDWYESAEFDDSEASSDEWYDDESDIFGEYTDEYLDDYADEDVDEYVEEETDELEDEYEDVSPELSDEDYNESDVEEEVEPETATAGQESTETSEQTSTSTGDQTVEPPIVSGNERIVTSTPVFFDTGSSQVKSSGVATIQSIAQLVQQQRATNPNATFRIAIVGSSSPRWRSPGDKTAQELNTQLSSDRATNVASILSASLSPNDLQSGICTVESEGMGSDLADAIGVDPDNDDQIFRSAQITVWITDTPVNPDHDDVDPQADGVILGSFQAERARTLYDQLSPDDQAWFRVLLDQAGSDDERQYLYKALAAGHSIDEIDEFANRIRGQDAEWLQNNLRLTGNSEGRGIQQQWSHSCNATTVQAVMGEMDPIYALQIHDENPNFGEVNDADATDRNPNLAEDQREMLESAYTGTKFGAHSGVAADRGDPASGQGRWADDLLNDRSDTTGLHYTPQLVPEDLDIEEAIDHINTAVDQGMPVPIVIGNGPQQYTHYVLVTGRSGNEYTIHDPWTGDTVTRSEDDLRNGTLNIAGSNQINEIEDPSANPEE
jgi:outer membrane protein OmpA-like peptidoglycan-associated protein